MLNKILIIAICGLFGSMNVMTAYAQGAQGQIAPQKQLPNLVGLLAKTDHLEKLGIFSIDNITAAASLYALQDMSQTPGAKEHLRSGFFEYFQHQGSERKKLVLASRECNRISEPFAIKDCQTALLTGFVDYGRRINKGKWLNVYARMQRAEWDEARKRLIFKSIQPLTGSTNEPHCIQDAICAAVAPTYAQGQYVVCYKLDFQPPQATSLPLTEAEARSYSQKVFDQGYDAGMSYLYEIIDPLKPLPQPQKCSREGSGSQVAAIGKARLVAEIYWSRQTSEFVRYAKDIVGTDASKVNSSPTPPRAPVITPLQSIAEPDNAHTKDATKVRIIAK